MFGGEEGGLAALGELVLLGAGGHGLDGPDLQLRQPPQAVLSVADHALHRAQLPRHHGDLGLGGGQGGGLRQDPPAHLQGGTRARKVLQSLYLTTRVRL